MVARGEGRGDGTGVTGVNRIPVMKPFLGEEVEPSGQHVAGDPKAALQLVESVGAEQQVAQHQQAPAFAGDLERTGDRAVLVGVGAVQHRPTG